MKPATREGATARPSPAPSMCFVDTMRPVTPAETAAWRFYLALHREHWRAARMAFRRVCAGEAPGIALIEFVAPDVCRVLEMSDVTSALRVLDEDEKGPLTVKTLGGDQMVNCISEPGLYKLMGDENSALNRTAGRYYLVAVIRDLLRMGLPS